MGGVIANYHHFYTFIFVVSNLILYALSINDNTLSSTESLTVSGNRTIVSPGDDFELGFFKPPSGSGWYLGIWYKKIPVRTYVWVANRDNPLSNSIGTLKTNNSNLVLHDHAGSLVWSTNLTKGDGNSQVVAELLANGNFVLRYSTNNDSGAFLWQSFDFPTDTLLPQMKLGWDVRTGRNRFLRSWRSQDDPSSGDYFYKLETQGLPEFFLWVIDARVHRSGPWDGIRFSSMPEAAQSRYMVYNFTYNLEEVAYTFQMTDHKVYSRLTMTSSGFLQRLTWTPTIWGWNQVWSLPTEQCEMYQKCGPYAYCDSNTSPLCNCIRGFDPKNQQEWDLSDGSTGCVRRTRLSCNGDGFHKLKKMKLPDTTAAIVDWKIDLKECKKRCLENCNCTALANIITGDGRTGCVIWTVELEDLRNYPTDGQDLYVKLAAIDIGEEKIINKKNIISLIVGVSVVLLVCFIMFCYWKKKQMRATTIGSPIVNQATNQDLQLNEIEISSRRHLFGDTETEDLDLPLMAYEVIAMATDNFSDSNMLGQGGFGIVYKGRLLDGQEIAVKRLSKMSHQGTTEFKNEVTLISKLQHINLVRLLGCCIDTNEKMLIYEYLENLSLDTYLFDKTKSIKLNWQQRFDITNGIARGLLYLHQDSRFRIIHRDLKASNVLLDKDMTPKISDFGMARIFGRDETEANTMKVVGTYGYMSPEYAMDGIFSVKSDTFSFGVLILEIVSGKRNRGFYNSDHDSNLLGYVWRKWEEGKGLEIVDSSLIDSLSSSPSSFRPEEALRFIQIGLLCVQEYAKDRPTMPSVVLMLGSETAAIPQPKPPGFCVERSHLEADLSSSQQLDDESYTVNQITVSVIKAR